MRIAVHALFLAPAVLAAAALVVQPAMAASRVNVPFNFIAAGQNCPAGSYLVTQDNNGATIKLEGPAHSFAWIATPGDPSPTDRRVILTFDEVGSTHMLRSVQYGAMITNRLDKKLKKAIPVPERAVAGL